MYYTYILQSAKDKQFYTGFTKDLKLRFEQHNKGVVESTANRRPFKLIYYALKLIEVLGAALNELPIIQAFIYYDIHQAVNPGNIASASLPHPYICIFRHFNFTWVHHYQLEFAIGNPDDEPTAEARLIYRPNAFTGPMMDSRINC